MNIRRYITTASVVCTMALSGAAFADTGSDVTISGTGPDSHQTVEINNSDTTKIENNNDVNVLNFNDQSAKTGNVKAEDITSVGGGLGSGNAHNGNATATDINISNGKSAEVVVPVGAGAGGAGGTTEVVTPGAGAGAGEVMGAAVTPGMGAGASMLPEVGAKFPVDVSALRAGWNTQSAPAANLAKGSSLFTNAMLLTATLLSLLGAVGSAWWAKRREVKA